MKGCLCFVTDQGSPGAGAMRSQLCLGLAHSRASLSSRALEPSATGPSPSPGRPQPSTSRDRTPHPSHGEFLPPEHVCSDPEVPSPVQAPLQGSADRHSGGHTPTPPALQHLPFLGCKCPWPPSSWQRAPLRLALGGRAGPRCGGQRQGGGGGQGWWAQVMDGWMQQMRREWDGGALGTFALMEVLVRY